MGGGFLILEVVVDADAGEVALTKAQHRSGDAAIDGEHTDESARRALEVLGDVQVVFDHTLAHGWLCDLAGIARKEGGRCQKQGTASKKKDFHEKSEPKRCQGEPRPQSMTNLKWDHATRAQ